MSEGNCGICGKEIEGMFVGYGIGRAHAHCYERKYQPLTAQNLFEVARGVGGDPVLAAKVIVDLIPEHLAADIVRTYNRRLLLQWEKRCEEPA